MSGKLGLFISLMLAFTLLSLAGCKSDEEKIVSYYEDLASIVDSNKDDCDKMGEELHQWLDKNGPDLQKLVSEPVSRTEAESKKLQEKYGERLTKAMDTLLMGMARCSMDNENVDKALDRFGKIIQ